LIMMYSIPDVEFEFCVPALLICRADLPGGGVDIDIILGQKVCPLCNCSDVKGLIDHLHVPFHPGVKYTAPNNDHDDDHDDHDDALSWGTMDILAWRDPFDGTLRYAKTRVTSHYTIEEVEEMARQKVEKLQPVSND